MVRSRRSSRMSCDPATRSTQNRVGLKNPGAQAAAAFLARNKTQLPTTYGINIAVPNMPFDYRMDESGLANFVLFHGEAYNEDGIEAEEDPLSEIRLQKRQEALARKRARDAARAANG